MRKNIEKNFFDWRQDKTPKIQAKGVAAMLMLSQKLGGQNQPSSRCVWNSVSQKEAPRYLTRKIVW